MFLLSNGSLVFGSKRERPYHGCLDIRRKFAKCFLRFGKLNIFICRKKKACMVREIFFYES